jgi:hypothetical protein
MKKPIFSQDPIIFFGQKRRLTESHVQESITLRSKLKSNRLRKQREAAADAAKQDEAFDYLIKTVPLYMKLMNHEQGLLKVLDPANDPLPSEFSRQVTDKEWDILEEALEARKKRKAAEQREALDAAALEMVYGAEVGPDESGGVNEDAAVAEAQGNAGALFASVHEMADIPGGDDGAGRCMAERDAVMRQDTVIWQDTGPLCPGSG